jgi:hypothetical protein
MKYLKLNSFLLFITILAGTVLAKAQDDDRVSVKEMIDTRNFVFKAQMMSPMGGRLINLTSDYDFTVRPDSIVSYLPYFGRAYSAPINPTDGGIKFTSTKFDYKTTKRKKSWDISIQTRDVGEGYQLFLSVYNNGRATLRANSVNKQSIVFDGYITEGRPLNKKGF